jgi:hypothetical protein
MPIHTFGGFDRMTTLCKTLVPQKIRDALEPIKVIHSHLFPNIFQERRRSR